MARNGSGVYSLPGTYLAVSGETIEAQQHNDPLEDLESDANTARPVVAGGTGASSVADARTNLGMFASGTRLPFHQSAAPTGWTQDTTVNDKVLRVVSTAGGGSGGSWTISGISVDGHAITVPEMPTHSHPATVTDPTHVHTFPPSRIGSTVSTGSGSLTGTTGSSNTTQTDAAATGITVTTSNIGGSAAHTHSLTIGSAWRPAYTDIIVCSKA